MSHEITVRVKFSDFNAVSVVSHANVAVLPLCGEVDYYWEYNDNTDSFLVDLIKGEIKDVLNATTAGVYEEREIVSGRVVSEEVSEYVG